MFSLSETASDYLKRRVDAYDNKHDNQTIMTRLIANGVYVPFIGVAVYWGLPHTDVKKILSSSLLVPKMIKDKEYYFRPDIWSIHKSYQKYLSRYRPDHIRYNQDLVTCDDIAVFFELARSSANKILISNKLKPVTVNGSKRVFMYKYSDIMSLERRSQVFSRSILRSHGTESKKQGFTLFRDSDCPRFEDCTDLACVTTDYMNCRRCARHFEAATSPLDVFVADTGNATDKLNSYIAIKLGGNLALLPNVAPPKFVPGKRKPFS